MFNGQVDLGQKYYNVPHYNTTYGYHAMTATFGDVERGVLPFPALRPPFVLESTANCFGQPFCILSLHLDMKYFFDRSYLVYTGTSSLFTGGNMTCSSSQGIPIITVQDHLMDDAEGTHFAVATATPEAYLLYKYYRSLIAAATGTAVDLGKSTDLINSITQPYATIDALAPDSIVLIDNFITLQCLHHSWSMWQVTGSNPDDLVPALIDPADAHTPIRYLQPIISTGSSFFSHTTACLVGKPCEFKVQLSDGLVRSAALIRIDFPIAAVFYLKTNEVCVINQFRQDQVHLQVVRRVNPNVGEVNQNFCTLIFTPKIAAVPAVMTPEAYRNVTDMVTATVGIYTPDSAHIPDVDAYIAALRDAPVPLNLTHFVALPGLGDYHVPFNTILESAYMSITAPSCTAAVTCEFTYHIFTPIGFQQVRAQNFLRWTDTAMKLACSDAVGVVAYITLDPSLDWIYLTPVSPLGLQFGSCSFPFVPLFDKPARPAIHQFLLSRADTYPLFDLYDPNAVDPTRWEDAALLTETVTVPNSSPHRSSPWAWYASPNTHNNVITFKVSRVRNDHPTTTTSNELFFTHSSGLNVFEISDVNCFLGFPDDTDPLIIGPRCEAYQKSPNSIELVYSQATTVNVGYVIISFSLGNHAPTHFHSLTSVVSTRDRITGVDVVSNLLSAVGLPFPAFRDIGPKMWAPKQSATPPATAQDVVDQTIHLFTNTPIPMKLALSNGVMIGSTLVFQLYQTDASTFLQTPLYWALDNTEELLTRHGLELLPHDESCLYCIRFKVLPPPTPAEYYIFPEFSNDPILKAYGFERWFGRRYDDVDLVVRYLDLFSSWGSAINVKMLFKVETPVALMDWKLLMGFDVKHDITPTYSNNLSPVFVTFSPNTAATSFFFDGLQVTAVLGGADADSGLRSNVTITHAWTSSPITELLPTLKYTPTVKRVAYTYTFKAIAPWELSMPSCNTTLDASGVVEMDCDGAFTSLLHLSPLQHPP